MKTTHRITYYPLSTYFWCFTLFSLFGYVFETLVRLVRYGNIAGTQGLIGLPFSQIYGFGALLLIGMYPYLKKWHPLIIFMFSSVLGGFYEYMASYIQEQVFHTTSWDYSMMSTSIGGRTNLLYALVWGGLSLMTVRYVFPSMITWLNEPKHSLWYFMTWLLFMVLLFDAICSALACQRYVERSQNNEPKTELDVFLDTYFPDEIIQKTYPYLHILP